MKDALRNKFAIKRKYFQHSAREVADGAISDALLCAFENYESFAIYCSFGAEADTHKIIERLLSLGKRVYLPRTEGKELAFVPFDGDFLSLKKSALGVYEPQGQAYSGEISVCITPLLAINRGGWRLGYGGGYYDRFFTSHPQIIKAGIGYSFQMTEDMFEEDGDVPLDMFICEKGVTYFGRE